MAITTRQTWLAGIAFVAGLASSTAAQSLVVDYTLEDVWLLPDISHPGSPPQQMTGTFRWTYEAGAFDAGMGVFLSLSIPWYGDLFQDLEFVFDTGSIEIVLPGSYHDLGVDITLFFVEPLSPNTTTLIDTSRSQFDVQRGISHQGHVTSGAAVPHCPGDVNGDRTVDLNDLSVLLANFGAGTLPAQGDLDGDGDVDLADLSVLLASFGTACA